MQLDPLASGIIGWLTQVFGTAGLQAGKRLTQGSEVERALRAALSVGLETVVAQVPQSNQDQFALVLADRFNERILLVGNQERLLDTIWDGVRTQLGPLADPDLAPGDRSYLDQIGINVDWLSEALVAAILQAIKRAAIHTPALHAVQMQLQSEIQLETTLTSSAKIQQMIREVPTQVAELGRGGAPPEPTKDDPAPVVVEPGSDPDGPTTATLARWIATNARRSLEPFSEEGPKVHPATTQVSESGNVAVVTGGGQAYVYDCASGGLIVQRDHRRDFVRMAAVSPTGDLLATATKHAVVRLWRIPSGVALGDPLRPGPRSQGSNYFNSWAVGYRPYALRFDSSGQRLAIRVHAQEVSGNMRADHAKILVWDTTDLREPVLTLDNLSVSKARFLEFSSDGARILVEGLRELLVVDVASAYRVAQAHHGDWLQAASLTNKTRLVTVDKKNIRIWTLDGQTEPVVLPHSHRRLSAAAISHDGRYAATAGTDRQVRLWDLDIGKELLGLSPADKVRAIAFSPTGRLWAVASGQHVNVLGLRSTDTLWLPHTQEVTSVGFSSDGTRLFSVSGGKVFGVWTLAGQV